jgi:hypothetical protein
MTRIDDPSRNKTRVLDGTKRTIARIAMLIAAPARNRRTILISMKARHCTTRDPFDTTWAKPCTSIACDTGSR